MANDMENRLTAYYSQFDRNHEQRRQQLTASLSSVEVAPVVAGNPVRSLRVSRWYRSALAAAAVLLIAFGVSLMFDTSAQFNPQTAWAEAIDNAGHVESVHVMAKTPGSSLEMWWRQPNDFRMAFNNGNIITHNSTKRCNFNQQTNTFVQSPGGATGFEMLILGELGQIFTKDHKLGAMSLRNCTMISTKKVTYKGENCQELTFVKDQAKGTYLICVMDARENFIYDLKMYNQSRPDKILYHIEVLDVDKTMPDTLFELEAQPGQRVVDRM